MGRVRRAALVGSLACLPLLAALPAVADRLADVLPLRPGSVWVAQEPQLHRGAKVTITGAAEGELRPGTSATVVLSLRNPNPHAVSMNRVRVQIARITAPNADAAHPCTRADYAVTQMARGTFQLPARRTVDMADLGLPRELWPTLTMRYRPVNQDGCRGARLKLTFKARGLHQ